MRRTDNEIFNEIKAIDAMLPNEDNFLRWERLSKRGKVHEGDYMKCAVILTTNELI